MAMSRKDFMLEVASKLKENPRAVLAGHGISANVLQEVVKREDILAKLAGFLYSTIYGKKGAMGLKKAPNLSIKGYKSFPEFNLKARTDVETFMEGLGEKDSGSFTNNGNILVFYFKPGSTNNDEDLSDSEQITTGLSLKVTFDTAVSKEMKSLGGMYLTVMFGDSAIRTAEMKIAERNAKKNARIQTKRTPAKLKMELKAKANKKLSVLKKKKSELQEKAFNTAAELEQFSAIGGMFGAKQGSVRSAVSKMGSFDNGIAAVKEAIGNDPENRKLIGLAQKYVKSGNIKMAKTLLAEVGNQAVTDYVLGGSIDGSADVVNSRKLAIKKSIKRLTAKNDQLLVDLALAPNENAKRSVRSMISKNNTQIKTLRAKLGTYKDMSISAMNKKAAMLKETNAAIQTNIAMGDSIVEALNSAIADLEAKDGEKAVIKQQIMEQVAKGIPVQYAVQQSLQQFQPQQADSGLSGGMDLDTLMASI